MPWNKNNCPWNNGTSSTRPRSRAYFWDESGLTFAFGMITLRSSDPLRLCHGHRKNEFHHERIGKWTEKVTQLTAKVALFPPLWSFLPFSRGSLVLLAIIWGWAISLTWAFFLLQQHVWCFSIKLSLRWTLLVRIDHLKSCPHIDQFCVNWYCILKSFVHHGWIYFGDLDIF